MYTNGRSGILFYRRYLQWQQIMCHEEDIFSLPPPPSFFVVLFCFSLAFCVVYFISFCSVICGICLLWCSVCHMWNFLDEIIRWSWICLWHCLDMHRLIEILVIKKERKNCVQEQLCVYTWVIGVHIRKTFISVENCTLEAVNCIFSL